jgi:hypothetical protein
MSEHDNDEWPVKAYKNIKFLKRREARTMRILSEYLEPENRFEDFNVSDTIVFSDPPGCTRKRMQVQP